MLDTITLTPFENGHLSAAARLSQAEGWPHRPEDWAMLLLLSHGVVARQGSEVIGTALATPFGPEISTANMIIVAEAARGRGLGRRLMEAVLPSSGGCRLVATAAGLPLYQKLGFSKTGEILQLQGVLQDAPAPDPAVRPMQPGELPQVVALENAAFGGDRSALVSWLAGNAEVFCFVDETGHITGYTARRRFGRGYVIGPIAAPDEEAAKALIATAAQGLEGSFVRVDTDSSSGLAPFLERLGLAGAGTGVAMLKGAGPAAPPRFGLFSQALG